MSFEEPYQDREKSKERELQVRERPSEVRMTGAYLQESEETVCKGKS